VGPREGMSQRVVEKGSVEKLERMQKGRRR
jgi:hypothetical protein